MGTRALLAGAVAAAVALAAAPAPPAAAKDPGRWKLVRVSRIPFSYFQGVTATPGRALFFTGTNGLFATTAGLRETARREPAIPPEVQELERYDHIGDLSYDAGEGGRLLLPLECYRFNANPPNHCGTGSIGVADPATLAWRYYVKLDPAEIKKAMWNEASPDGRWLYTQDGLDLLTYDLSQVSAANAAPAGPALRPVRRLRRAFPFGSATGATFYRGRLLVAQYRLRTFRVWSLDTTTGRRRLEIERSIVGESEGLAVARVLGGTLHWQVMPVSSLGVPTYGAGRGALLTFKRRRR